MSLNIDQTHGTFWTTGQIAIQCLVPHMTLPQSYYIFSIAYLRRYPQRISYNCLLFAVAVTRIARLLPIRTLQVQDHLEHSSHLISPLISETPSSSGINSIKSEKDFGIQTTERLRLLL
ncbi:hypothetical protein HZ326_4428 [Fusarium oxysporum f. sp. albedinis]|nr:hypothetical protein HZ326_4428 [Fusarium oxysporum f. sp. albedinis]